MDNYENHWNPSDTRSESQCTNLSSLSSLIELEEEIYEGKSRNNNDQQRNVLKLEEKVRKLTSDLQSAKKLNEKYKNDLISFQCRGEIENHEKFGKLITKNVHLEKELSLANERFYKFLNKNKINEDAKQNIELYAKLNSLQNDIKTWKNDAEMTEIRNKQLKIEIEEIRIDVSTKNKTIEGLKSKIVDLHLEIQNLTQENTKQTNSSRLLGNELESSKKSEDWYKKQLHECRGLKLTTSEEVAKLELLLIGKEHDLDTKTLEITKLKHNLREILDKLPLNQVADVPNPPIASPRQKPIESWELTIAGLTNELSTIKEAVNEKDLLFESTNRENARLRAQLEVLQQKLNKNEIFITNLELNKQELNKSVDFLTQRLAESEKLYVDVTNEKTQLEVTLRCAHREKYEIEEVVKIIRENFSKFADSHKKIKQELCEKTKESFALRDELNDLKEAHERESNLLKKSLDENKDLNDFLQAETEKFSIENLNKSKEVEKINGMLLEILNWILNNLKRICHPENCTDHLKPLVTDRTVEILIMNINQLFCDITSNEIRKIEHHGKVILINKQSKALFSKILNRLNYLNNKCHQIQIHHKRNHLILQDVVLKSPRTNASSNETIPFSETNTSSSQTCASVIETNASIREIQPLLETNASMRETNESLKETTHSLSETNKIADVKQLKILYKAKALENVEKQKKFEANNRTLLKKVKEQINERKRLEERCDRLQDMYNGVFEELNTLKLLDKNKNEEIESLLKICDQYKMFNGKLNEELQNIEVHKSSLAVQLLGCEATKANLENTLEMYQKQMDENSIRIEHLSSELQRTSFQKNQLEAENDSLNEQLKQLTVHLNKSNKNIKRLECSLEEQERTSMELGENLLSEQKRCAFLMGQFAHIQLLLEENREENKLLRDELQILNGKLEHANNELIDVNKERKLWENHKSTRESLIVHLQSESQMLEKNLVSIKSEKWFYQKLCNDLKLSLETHMNHSKVLKKRIQTLSAETRECNSLPDLMMNLPSPTQFDDAGVMALLKQFNTPTVENPLGRLENCLNLLKKEMTSLRKHVTDKAMLDAKFI